MASSALLRKVVPVFERWEPLMIVLGIGLFTAPYCQAQDSSAGTAVSPLTIAGTVQNAATGEAIGNAQCLIGFREKVGMQLSYMLTQTDASGQFNVPLPDHAFTQIVVRIWSDGFEMRQMQRSRSKLVDSTRKGAAISLDLQLEPKQKAQARVVDPDGNPIVGAVLYSIQEYAPQESFVWAGQREWEAWKLPPPVSDENGVLDLSFLPNAGRYSLAFGHPDFALSTVGSAKLNEQPLELKMDLGSPAEFTVTYESNPKSIAQATLKLTLNDESGPSFISFPFDESGKLQVRLSNRPTTVRVEHPTLTALPWYFYRPEEPKMAFTLHETGTIQGRVLDEQGTGIAGVSVQAATGNRVVETDLTNERGEYELTVAESSYKVSVSTYGGRWKRPDTSYDADVTAGEKVDVPEFTLKEQEPYTGQVLDRDQTPVPTAIILSSFRNGSLADEQGKFKGYARGFGGPRVDGPIHILHPFKRQSIVVASASLKNYEPVNLAGEGSVVGIVTDMQGHPLEGIPIGLEVLFSRNGGGVSTVLRTVDSGDDGTFKFVGLSEGLRYSVLVQGRVKAVHFDRRQVKNDSFEVGKSAPPRKVLKVDEELLKELKSVKGATPKPPANLPPLDRVQWLNELRPAKTSERRYTVLILATSTREREDVSRMAKLYADSGLQIVVLLPSDRVQKEPVPELPYPIGIMNEGLLANDLFSPIPRWFPVYDREGKTVLVLRRSSELLEIRNLMVYGSD